MKRLTVAACAALLLAGCATHERFVQKMNGFVGSSESVLAMTYGPPMSSYPLSDGSKVIRYERGGTVVIPGITSYTPVTTNTYGTASAYGSSGQSAFGNYAGTSTTMVPTTGAPISIRQWCAVNFTISAAGAVAAWAAEGNHCVSQ